MAVPGGWGGKTSGYFGLILPHLTRATPEGCGGSKKSSKIDAKRVQKPSKKRYEKRVEKKRLQVAFARINRGDPGPVRGKKNTYRQPQKGLQTSTRHIQA